MPPTVVILRQFSFAHGGTYTPFEQQHTAADMALATSLPNLYAAFLIKEVELTTEVIGGCFFVTDAHHENESFESLLFETVTQVEPCASMYKLADSIKSPRLTRAAQLPEDLDLDAYAVTQYTALGKAGTS